MTFKKLIKSHEGITHEMGTGKTEQLIVGNGTEFGISVIDKIMKFLKISINFCFLIQFLTELLKSILIEHVWLLNTVDYEKLHSNSKIINPFLPTIILFIVTKFKSINIIDKLRTIIRLTLTSTKY